MTLRFLDRPFGGRRGAAVRLALTVGCLSLAATAAGASPAFCTWDGFEPDKLAAIWLVERFIALPGTRVHVAPRGRTDACGFWFDVPHSDLRRRHDQAVFEALLARFGLDEPRLERMARLIHDLEINIWEDKVFRLTPQLQTVLTALIADRPDPAALIGEANAYFDRLYRTLPDRLARFGD